MKKSNNSKSLAKFFAFLAIPATALILSAFSEKEYVVPESIGEITTVTITPQKPVMVRDEAPKPLTESVHPPLIIINGKEASDINDLNLNEITSISILKNEKAVSHYGEKAKNGVIVITTKETSQQDETVISNENLDDEKTSFVIRTVPDIPKGPLVIIDNKESNLDLDALKKISREDIETVTVLKDKSATDRYGKKGMNGVLLITTKHAK